MTRIARLDLERWGHFEGRTLVFAPGGRLHVVQGGNEAGKSTTRRAITALLFGMPDRTVDRRWHHYNDLRVGALLELPGGTTLEVVRRKGRKDTLRGPDGAVLDPDPLAPALHGLGSDAYEALFEISHDSLVQGGHQLLEGGGAVGESLFSAGAGARRLQGLLRELEAEADELFTPRGRVKSLNVALNAYADATRDLREAALRPPQHAERVRALAEVQSARDAIDGELAAVEREHARLARLRAAAPLVARRAAMLAELAELGDLPTLEPGADLRRGEAQRRRDEARTRAGAAERAIARQRPALETLQVPEDLLGRAGDVSSLYARTAGVREDADRRDGLVRDLEEARAELGRALAAARPAIGDRSLDTASLDDLARERLERCLEERAGVEGALEAARETAREARRRAEEADRALEATPAVQDAVALAAAVRAARPALAAEDSAATARAEAATALRRAQTSAGRLRPPIPSLSELDALRIPPAEAVERLLERLVGLAQQGRDLDRDARTLDARRTELDRDAATLPPLSGSERDALERARTERDERWLAVRGALEQPRADAEAIAGAYERSVIAADDVADDQLRHADELARRAEVERAQAVLEIDAGDLVARRDRHTAELAEAHADWDALWDTATVRPDPEEAGAWLAVCAEALAHRDAAATATERAENFDSVVARHAAALEAALRSAGTEPPASAGLAMLVELADGVAEELAARRAARERLAEAARGAAEAVRLADEQLTSAEREAAAWRERWATLRGACGLEATLAPEAALSAVRRLTEATTLQARVSRLDGELERLDARADRFAEEVTALVHAIGDRDLAGRTPIAGAEALQQLVGAGQAAASERDALARELAAHEADLAAAAEDVAAAEDDLARLRAAARATDDAELVAVERCVARATALRDELPQLDLEVSQAGAGSVEEVAVAVAELDLDEVLPRVSELEARRDELRDRRDDRQRDLTRATDELAALERSEQAATAAQEAAARLAEARELAERYARARLGHRVLRDAVERYRQEHQGPTLARANELFPKLTCGSYVQLVAELDDDRWVLIAVDAAGARRRVEELSDGTREQLFLALRVATIERVVALSGPVPVVCDDVFLESDDQRAAQILEVLADLARRTQVIVLTHHAHLVTLARQHVGARRLDLLDLDAVPEPESDREPVSPSLAEGDPGMPSLADELAGALDEPYAQGVLL